MAQSPSFTPSSTPEDVILNFERFETTAAGAVKKVIERVNVTQGSTSYIDPDDGSAYVPTGTVASAPIRTVLGTELIDLTEVANAGGATALTVPANAAHAEISVYDADGIVYTVDGTDPAGAAGAPTTGFRLNSGAVAELQGADELANFGAFSLRGAAGTTTGSLYVQYFNMEAPAGTAD